MAKFFFVLVAAFALTACGQLIDPLVQGTEMATAISVGRDLHKNCVVTFRKEGDKRLYVSVPSSPYEEARCLDIEPGQTIPIVADPVVGSYPYVLFESIAG